MSSYFFDLDMQVQMIQQNSQKWNEQTKNMGTQMHHDHSLSAFNDPQIAGMRIKVPNKNVWPLSCSLRASCRGPSSIPDADSKTTKKGF